MTPDPKTEEILSFLKEERSLNNARFTQVSTGLMDLKEEVGQLKVELTAKIDKVYDSLAQDIQVFGEDLIRVKQRVAVC